jgi:hypothetical protein
MQTTGSNLNAGSTLADNPVYSSTSGNFDGTSIYTPTDGQTTSSLVNVGDWASIFPTANTTTPYVAQVTNVGAGVNGTITVSTTAKFGTAPGAVACKCRTGGAWADFGMLAAGVALNTGTVAQSTRINLKAGTYSNGATGRNFGLIGTATTPLMWRGYKTTIGDQEFNNAAVAGTDIPAYTSTTGQVTQGTAAGYQIFQNIDFSGAATGGNGFWVCSAGYTTFYGCRITNIASNANSSAIQMTSNGSAARFIRCKLTATTTATRCVYVNAAVYAQFYGCDVIGGIQGIEQAGGATATIIKHVILEGQTGDAIKLTTNALIDGATIYNPGGNGINITVVSGNSVPIINCYIEGVTTVGKAGINNTSGTSSINVIDIGNAFYNCVNNRLGITENFYMADVGSLAASALRGPAAHDFTLRSIGQARAFPGPFENVTAFRGYLDNGAVQHGDPSIYRGRRGT